MYIFAKSLTISSMYKVFNFPALLECNLIFRALPRRVSQEEMQAILGNVSDTETKELIQEWYKLDQNSIEPNYVLKPISSMLPEFLTASGKLSLT